MKYLLLIFLFYTPCSMLAMPRPLSLEEARFLIKSDRDLDADHFFKNKIYAEPSAGKLVLAFYTFYHQLKYGDFAISIEHFNAGVYQKYHEIVLVDHFKKQPFKPRNKSLEKPFLNGPLFLVENNWLALDTLLENSFFLEAAFKAGFDLDIVDKNYPYIEGMISYPLFTLIDYIVNHHGEEKLETLLGFIKEKSTFLATLGESSENDENKRWIEAFLSLYVYHWHEDSHLIDVTEILPYFLMLGLELKEPIYKYSYLEFLLKETKTEDDFFYIIRALSPEKLYDISFKAPKWTQEHKKELEEHYYGNLRAIADQQYEHNKFAISRHKFLKLYKKLGLNVDASRIIAAARLHLNVKTEKDYFDSIMPSLTPLIEDQAETFLKDPAHTPSLWQESFSENILTYYFCSLDTTDNLFRALPEILCRINLRKAFYYACRQNRGYLFKKLDRLSQLPNLKLDYSDFDPAKVLSLISLDLPKDRKCIDQMLMHLKEHGFNLKKLPFNVSKHKLFVELCPYKEGFNGELWNKENFVYHANICENRSIEQIKHTAKRQAFLWAKDFIGKANLPFSYDIKKHLFYNFLIPVFRFNAYLKLLPTDPELRKWLLDQSCNDLILCLDSAWKEAISP